MKEHEFSSTEIISQVLEPLEFIRDGNVWYREDDEHFYFLVLLNRAGDEFIEVRYSLKKAIPENWSFKDKWQASERIHELLDLHGALTYSFEFRSLSQLERKHRLEAALRERAIPLLNQFSTTAGLKEFDPAKIITKVLKPEGFKRTANYWFKESVEHFYFLHLDSWRGEKYIDIGVSFKSALKDGNSFKTSRHGGMRIHETAVLHGAMSYVHEYRVLFQKQRVLLLETALKDTIIPLLRQISTLQGVKELFLTDGVHFHIDIKLRHLIGIAER